MILKSVRVRNFRSIADEYLELDRLTALVGANGAGKSSFLRALEVFYAASPRIEQADFFGENTAQNIEIEVTFVELEPDAEERFQRYLQDGRLSVVRVISWNEGEPEHKYHGSRLAVPQFKQIREAKAREARKHYEDLRNEPVFQSLAPWQNQTQAMTALDDWENSHLEQCERQIDDGQFFGFNQVASGYLGDFTKLITIPAVRDAGIDAQEGRGSPLKEIVDLVVRATLAAHHELIALKEYAKQRYKEIVDPAKLSELRDLAGELTETLQTYVPDAAVHLDWLPPGEFEMPLPKTDVRLAEDGYPSSVPRTGHGLQRAFILTLLQRLAVLQPRATITPESGQVTPEGGDSGAPVATPKQPDLMLLIEEPELYQHPNRQRHLARIFQVLVQDGIGGAESSAQVLYSTHSPMFVGLDRFNQIRVLRKLAIGKDKPKATHVRASSLERAAKLLWEFHGKPEPPFTADSLLARLQTIMTPWMNEGFFADLVVLVEGETDRAAILGAANAEDVILEALGISVIPCMGKPNIDRPAIVFRSFGIPFYLLWDSDEGNKDPKLEINRRLLRIVRAPEEDYPAAVADEYACFKTDLETTLAEELGDELFGECITRLRAEFEIPTKEEALKKPVVVSGILRMAKEKGKESATLNGIVNKIVSLKLTTQQVANGVAGEAGVGKV